MADIQTIIDSHIHFLLLETLHYPWLDDLLAPKRAFLPADYAWQGQGWIVEQAVFVQADCLPEQAYEEAVWAASLASAGAPISGVVAFASLELGECARPALEALRAVPLVKGVRRLIQSEAPGFCIQPNFVTGVRLLAEFGYAFDICIKPHQLLDVIALVKACPYGSERLMFGSDWPVVTLAGGAERWTEMLLNLVASLSINERKLLFYENVRRFYDLSGVTPPGSNTRLF